MRTQTDSNTTMDSKTKLGWTETKQLDAKTVETVYFGKILPEMIDEVIRDLEVVLKRMNGGDWLVDFSKVEGFRAAGSGSTSTFFAMFRTSGGKRIAAIVGSSPLRMIGSALAFASGHDIKLFSTREEALKYLHTSP